MTQAEIDLQTFLVDHVVPYVVQMRTDLTSAQQTITQLRTDLGLKANATTVQQLSQRVGTAETTLDTKATTAYVDTKDQAIAGIDADQTLALARFQQLLTTDEGVTQGILTTQSQHAATLAGLRTDVDLKATASTVSNIQGQVTTVKNLVNDSVTGLSATNALAAGAKTVADAALPKAGGTMTGPINALAPASSTQPLLLGQNPSGENRPFREFLAVATVPVVGTNPGTKATTIVDAMALGRAYSIRSLVVTMKEAPAVGVVTIASLYLVSPAGAVAATPFYQKTFAIGVLAVLNKPIEGLSTNADKYPEIATGYGVALGLSSGKCNANIDGILATPSTT